MNAGYSTLSLLLLCIACFSVAAQDVADMQDTLRPARVVSDMAAERNVGTRVVALPELRTIVAATGEADVIKYIQMLPGVSTGAESSSAIYVRGGNIGSNLITLDGVSLYGSSHLLGLTSVYPTEMISEASFRVGGFCGDDSNITASHISLKTADGSFTKTAYSVSASTFLFGGTVSVPLKRDKVSLIGSLRISPLGPEFRAVQSAVGGTLDSLSRSRAIVYDGLAKVKWLIDIDNTLSISVFGSQDAYSYCYGGDSDESMGWSNLVLNVRHKGCLDSGWLIEDGMSYNRFYGRQGIVRDMSGTVNNLAIINSLNELTADVSFFRPVRYNCDLRLGVRERFAWFNPGTSSTFKGSGLWKPMDSPRTDNVSHSSITSLHGHVDLKAGKRLTMMASAKLNVYAADEAECPSWKWRLTPEASFLARLNMAKWLTAETTVDWVAQYYHTLEGIPLGWSMDLLVPTSSARPPEKALQIYVGFSGSFGGHHVSVGAYQKWMKNLVYFSDASQLFSPAIAGWSHNVKVGEGSSRGIEFLYEKDGERLDWRLAYTLSKTDRTFEDVNSGETFPAKFDRRHILNATASCLVSDRERCAITLAGLFTFQSGHWETVAAGEYPAVTFFGQEYSLDYFSSVNNCRLPDYIRLDLSCSFSFKTRYPQDLTVGIYNVLNRHNPFSIIYDDRTMEWRKVSLIPIMPSFNYRIKF